MAMLEEEHEEVQEGAPAWMVTFADMVTLLLTFFVLLLSFANTDTEKFKEMLGSLKDAFGSKQEYVGHFEAGRQEIIERPPDIIESKAREKLIFFQELKKVVAKKIKSGATELEMQKDGIRLRIKGQALFKTGSAELSPDIFGIFEDIKKLLDKYQYMLIVEGHTDNIPIKSPIYPSNWELSAARAISVIRHFMETLHVSPNRLQAVGYAATRPLVNNSTAENRAKNRRVEFKFEQPILKKYKQKMVRPKLIQVDIFERQEQKREVIKQFQEELLDKTKDIR
jgi:chemotaxis protein MotB